MAYDGLAQMRYSGPSRLKLLVEGVFRSRSAAARPLRLPLRLLLHLEIAPRHFRNGLQLIHPYNIIVHPAAELGRNVTLYHNVTIATKSEGRLAGTPVIGDDVTIFPHSAVIGGVRIGHRSTIGAGSVVIESVPDDSVVAGNPARVIRTGSKAATP